MKVFIKKLGGTKFEIEVNLQHTVADVKRIIETVEGENVYRVARQILIHHGNILKDGTTLEENNVSENDGILVIEYPKKSSSSSAEASTSATTEEVAVPEQAELPSLAGALDCVAPNELDFLRESPHFLPLREMMVTNRRTVQLILDEWEVSSPELYKLINENMSGLLCLLYEHPVGSGKLVNCDLDEDEDEDYPRNWTNGEFVAIRRLEALGFMTDLVTEVFYTCNKDEETATEFLLSHVRFDD